MTSKRIFQLFLLVALVWSLLENSQLVRAGGLQHVEAVHVFKPKSPEISTLLQAEPAVSLVIDRYSLNIGDPATATVRLNNVPAEGYSSVEITCLYDPSVLEASNVAIGNLFGVDDVTAVNGPHDGRLIVAIAGTNGNRATDSGTVITFQLRGRQAGQSTVECQARVSKGSDALASIVSAGSNVLILNPDPTVTPTLRPSACDKAEFVTDVNVVPGSVISPGQSFTKTWRLKNTGTCTWTSSYRIAFFSGEQMGAPSSVSLPVSVPPGAMVDISLNMTAPLSPGVYRGYWIFQSQIGAPFGVGPLGNQPWFVDIAVPDGTLTPTPAVIPTATQTSIPCYRAELNSEVSVPLGTLILPGAAFTQHWQLTNTGSCTWTTAYQLVFNGGEYMDAPLTSHLPSNVVPGQSVILSLNFTAPVAIGRHTSMWRIRPAPGVEFGVGASGNDPLMVDIMVAMPTSTPGGPTATPMLGVAYDFVANACSATWSSGAGQLPCPGIDGDARGFVLKIDRPKLETGSIDSRPSLLTSPQDVQGGTIQGSYPAMHVLNGDRFHSTLSCEFGATSCMVIFRLDYKVGGDPVKTFWGPYSTQYDGRLNEVDIDLSPLAGQDVKLILTVIKPSHGTIDRALWVAPIIYRSDLVATATPTPTMTATQTPAPSSTPPVASNFIRVTSPNGGEILMQGSTYRITWDSTSDIKTVYIGYKRGDSGLDWIAPGIPNTGYYDWNVHTTGSQIKIYIYGYGTADTSDESDNFFTIVAPTPTVAPSGTLTGQVLASKPVTLQLFTMDHSLVASALAELDGTFNLTAPAGSYTILASASGHLSTLGSATIIGGSTSVQPPTRLLAGDVNGDTYIDPYDAMTIGMNYSSALPTAADLNNDGIINVLDLELLAKNYRKMGPGIWYGS